MPALTQALVSLSISSDGGMQHARTSGKGERDPNYPEPEGVEHPEGFFTLGPREVHPWHKPAMPTHAQLLEAVTAPVIVSPNPMVTQTINGSNEPTMQVPINSGPMTLDSSMFTGTMEVHLAGLGNSQARIFAGKKRFFQVMVQGRFKRRVDADGLCMGQEFLKAAAVPPWIGEMVLTAAAKVFSSSTQVDIYARLPYFMNPVLAACQMVNVSEPGHEPAMAEATEDMRLFAPALADKQGKPLSPDKRRRWCDTPANLKPLQFSTEHVYTFHIWQHLIDFSSYKLSVGGFINLDLAGVLNSQPLQLTTKDTHTDEYMFSMLVWHERLLYANEIHHASMAEALSERFSKWGSGLRGLLGGGGEAAKPGSQ